MPKPEGWVSPENHEPNEQNEAHVEPVSAAPDPTGSISPADVDEERHEADHVEQPQDLSLLQLVITRCANVISWIFVPMLMPVYGIILIFNLSFLSFAPFHTKLIFTLIVFGANFVVPLLLVLLLKKIGLIDDIGLNGRKERLIPYVIIILCLAATGLFLYLKMAPLWVAMFYAGGALAGLINLLVNFRWKISAHAAGIGGLVAMLIQITKEGTAAGGMTWWIVGSIMVAGFLGSARIWLGRHTLMQVLAGTAVGFLSVWALSLI